MDDKKSEGGSQEKQVKTRTKTAYDVGCQTELGQSNLPSGYTWKERPPTPRSSTGSSKVDNEGASHDLDANKTAGPAGVKPNSVADYFADKNNAAAPAVTQQSTKLRTSSTTGVVGEGKKCVRAAQAGTQAATSSQGTSSAKVDGPSWQDENCKLRLVIPNFSALEETMCSDAKLIEGVSWKIMVMPKQHMVQRKQQKCMGFFLQCSPEKAYSDQWSVHAVADMRMISYKTNVPHFARRTTHTYTSKENDWGYSCFMTWADILDESQGYIRDDTVILEIAVKADAPKNMMTHGEFLTKIERWIDLANLQMKNGKIDLALEANLSAMKFCKDKDADALARLEAQKESFVNAKLFESIERIEKGKLPVAPESSSTNKPTSLRQALTGAQKSLNGKITAKGGKKTRAVVTVQHMKKKKPYEHSRNQQRVNTGGTVKDAVENKKTSKQEAAAANQVGADVEVAGDKGKENVSKQQKQAAANEHVLPDGHPMIVASDPNEDDCNVYRADSVSSICANDGHEPKSATTTVTCSGSSSSAETDDEEEDYDDDEVYNEGDYEDQALDLTNQPFGSSSPQEEGPMSIPPFEIPQATLDIINKRDDEEDDMDMIANCEEFVKVVNSADDIFLDDNLPIIQGYNEEGILVCERQTQTMDFGCDVSDDDNDSIKADEPPPSKKLKDDSPAPPQTPMTPRRIRELNALGIFPAVDTALLRNGGGYTTTSSASASASHDATGSSADNVGDRAAGIDVRIRPSPDEQVFECLAAAYGKTAASLGAALGTTSATSTTLEFDTSDWTPAEFYNKLSKQLDLKTMLGTAASSSEENPFILQHYVDSTGKQTMTTSITAAMAGIKLEDLTLLRPVEELLESKLREQQAQQQTQQQQGSENFDTLIKKWLNVEEHLTADLEEDSVVSKMPEEERKQLLTELVAKFQPLLLSMDREWTEGTKLARGLLLQSQSMMAQSTVLLNDCDVFQKKIEERLCSLILPSTTATGAATSGGSKKMDKKAAAAQAKAATAAAAAAALPPKAPVITSAAAATSKTSVKGRPTVIAKRTISKALTNLQLQQQAAAATAAATGVALPRLAEPNASLKDNASNMQKCPRQQQMDDLLVAQERYNAMYGEAQEAESKYWHNYRQVKDINTTRLAMNWALGADELQGITSMAMTDCIKMFQSMSERYEVMVLTMCETSQHLQKIMEDVVGEKGLAKILENEHTVRIKQNNELTESLNVLTEAKKKLEEEKTKAEEKLTAQLQLVQTENEKNQKLQKELKDLKNQLKKSENKATKEENRATTLQVQANESDEKYKATKKELEQTRKKQADEKAKAKKEKERDTQTIRQQQSDITDRTAERDRARKEHEESNRQKEKVERDRRNVASLLTTQTDRARAAEASLMDVKMQMVIDGLKKKREEANAGYTETEENLKRCTASTRQVSDSEMLKKSLIEWKTAVDRIDTAIKTTKNEYETAIEAIKNGTKSMTAIGDIKPVQLDALPKLVKPPPVQVVAPSSASTTPVPPPIIPLVPAGVIGQQRTPMAARSSVATGAADGVPPSSPSASACSTPSRSRVSRLPSPGPSTATKTASAAAASTAPRLSADVSTSSSLWSWNTIGNLDILRPSSTTRGGDFSSSLGFQTDIWATNTGNGGVGAGFGSDLMRSASSSATTGGLGSSSLNFGASSGLNTSNITNSGLNNSSLGTSSLNSSGLGSTMGSSMAPGGLSTGLSSGLSSGLPTGLSSGLSSGMQSMPSGLSSNLSSSVNSAGNIGRPPTYQSQSSQNSMQQQQQPSQVRGWREPPSSVGMMRGYGGGDIWSQNSSMTGHGGQQGQHGQQSSHQMYGQDTGSYGGLGQMHQNMMQQPQQQQQSHGGNGDHPMMGGNFGPIGMNSSNQWRNPPMGGQLPHPQHQQQQQQHSSNQNNYSHSHNFYD